MTCKKLEKSISPLAARILTEMDKRSQQANYRSGSRRGTEHLPSLFDHSVILAALFMDPSVFTYLTGDQREIAKSHLASLWQRIEVARRRAALDDTTNADGHSNENEEIPATNSDSSSDEAEPSFLKSLREKDRDRERASESQVSILTKLEQYYRWTKMLKSKSNVLEFWDDRKKSHPELYALSCVVLAVPATQVSVERLFSGLNFLLIPLRMAMASSLVNDFLVIRNNTIMAEKQKFKLQYFPDV